MYAQHVPEIADYVAASPTHLYHAGRFVLATINRHFEDVPNVLRQIAMGDLRSLTAMQQRALRQFWNHKEEHYNYLIINDSKRDHTRLAYLARLPGLGLVKAGFMVQLLYPNSVVGCLDTRNVQMYGLRRTTFTRKPLKKSLASISLVNKYIGLCRQLGGSETLWDNWCIGLAVARPRFFPTAEYVSAMHVKCIAH